MKKRGRGRPAVEDALLWQVWVAVELIRGNGKARRSERDACARLAAAWAGDYSYEGVRKLYAKCKKKMKQGIDPRLWDLGAADEVARIHWFADELIRTRKDGSRPPATAEEIATVAPPTLKRLLQ